MIWCPMWALQDFGALGGTNNKAFNRTESEMEHKQPPNKSPKSSILADKEN